MRSFVTFLLLALLGAIAAFLISNTTPIALTFLGITSMALPLAVWMGGAILAGVATGLWFSILFRLAERRGARLESKRQKAASFGPDDFAMVDDGYDARDFASASDYGEGDNQSAGYDGAADDYRDNGDRNGDVGQSRRWKPFQKPTPPVDVPVDLSRDQGEFVGPSRQEAFEMVETEPPVYDANYRVIQPPEPEHRSEYEPESYDSTPYDSKPYDSKSYDSKSYDSEPYSSGPYDSEPYDSRQSYESEDDPYRAGGSYDAETSSSRSDGYRSDGYRSDGYNLGDYGDRADAYDSRTEGGETDAFGGVSDRAGSASKPQPTGQPTGQTKSQPKDDWDIDDALDW